jgi:hypothetical protein
VGVLPTKFVLCITLSHQLATPITASRAQVLG